MTCFRLCFGFYILILISYQDLNGFEMENEDQNLENKHPVPTEDLSIEILPVVYEIIRGIEKDHQDNTVKTRESLDTSQKVLELQKRLDQAKIDIRNLPGIQFNKEQQLNQLEALKTQLRLKQELIQKYRFMYPFEFQKP